MINDYPLAEKMRPTCFDDFYGQKHIVNENSLLRRAIKTGMLGSCIFYGPPGTGKTTLANIIANYAEGKFEKLNAVSSGVADAKKIIETAKKNKDLFGTKTYLLLDECHRWSKAQSDCVLSAIEDGTIIFIGSTTENPFISMTNAIVSRCRIFEFKPLDDLDIIEILNRAICDKTKGFGLQKISVDDEALKHIAYSSNGDVRNALNALELAVKSTPVNSKGEIKIDLLVAEQSTQNRCLSIDETKFYDILSAFCKSIRGSDSDAAIYYMCRLIKSGVDPKIICRRLIAHCSEDIGMADSNALLLATSAMQSIEKIGLPECLLNLTHAIIYACEAEKSNSVVLALNNAMQDVEKYADDSIPSHLLNHKLLNDKSSAKYKYPHDFGGYVKQQYLPNKLKQKEYYIPLQNGKEKNMIKKKNKFN